MFLCMVYRLWECKGWYIQRDGTGVCVCVCVVSVTVKLTWGGVRMSNYSCLLFCILCVASLC